MPRDSRSSQFRMNPKKTSNLAKEDFPRLDMVFGEGNGRKENEQKNNSWNTKGAGSRKTGSSGFGKS